MSNTVGVRRVAMIVVIMTVYGICGCGRQDESDMNIPARSSRPTEASTQSSDENSSEEISELSLLDAATVGNLDAVRQHVESGTDLNQRAPETQATPLIIAATFGHVDVANLLIEHGVDLELKNSDGSNALHVAAFFCRREIVRSLLEKGADRNSRNNSGSTALDSVAGPFEEVKPIYDLLRTVLGPFGLELDDEFLKENRPRIAELLQN